MFRTTIMGTAMTMIASGVMAEAPPAQGGTLTVPIIAPTLTQDFNPFSNA